jgi:segregation and condensation protein B
MLDQLESILEAVLFAATEPLSAERLQQIIADEFDISVNDLRITLQKLVEVYQDRGIELVEVASGYRFQTKKNYQVWIQKLEARKTNRYSRSFLEILALIAYRQPITRGEIEDIRGVVVSSQIMKSLQELEWIKIMGYRDVPGKPALYGTTKRFLDDFNLKQLSELPVLPITKNLDQLELQLSEQLQLETVD